MSISEKLSLGLNTTIIGLCIVFLVLIALWLIIILEHKIVDFFGGFKGRECKSPDKQNIIADGPNGKKGRALGESKIEGIEDDETVAAILAVISDYAEIPMDELKITAIRAVD